MNKSNISRRDFMNGFALSLAAGSAMASIELLAQASSCTPYQYTVTQIPYAIIATLISVVGYLLLVYF
jgi:hypothetical protein